MFVKTSLFFLSSCFSLIATPDAPQAIEHISPFASIDQHLEQIETGIEKALKTFDVPGVAVGIVVDGKIVFAKGFGHCNRKQKSPVTGNTLFPIMSCTKGFTTCVFGQLVDERLLQWDDPVIKYLPEFRFFDERGQKITLRDLLAHRTGLPRHDVLWYNSTLGRNDSKEEVTSFLQRLQYLEPLCPLQEKYIYNNWMYYVAGTIIEKVTETTWGDSINKRIFSRLGMRYTDCLSENSSLMDNFAKPHSERKGKQVEIPFFDISLTRAAGAIYSCVNDMTKWIQLQISEGKFLGEEFLTQETFNEIRTLQIHLDPIVNGPQQSFGYGLGWHIGKYRDCDLVDHGGAMDGFYSNVALLPKQNIGIVVLGNSSFYQAFFPNTITNMIFDILLGYDDMDWILHNMQKWQSLKIHQQEKRKEKEAKRHLDTQPSLSLEDYVGEYQHPGYGTMKISLQNNQLFARYYRLTLPLTHWEYDIFEISDDVEEPTFIGRNLYFVLDAQGKIQALKVAFEPSLPPIEFERK